MATYKYKLYQLPGGSLEAARQVDELPIEADDAASAIAIAKTVRAPFEFEADYVALYTSDDAMIWHMYRPDAEEVWPASS
jgi:hypothetical protein